VSLNVGEFVAYLTVDDSDFNKKMDQDEKKASGFSSAIRYGAVAAGTAVVAVMGTALVKGFQRLTAIENATAKLRGLGNSAATVKAVMADALASVKGTAFGLDEAATTAAGAVAAGITPGIALAKNLRLVADAATIAQVSMADMGGLFNKVAASGKLQGQEIQQLNDRGVPIMQFLSDTLGKTTDEVYNMAEAGEISFHSLCSRRPWRRVSAAQRCLPVIL